MSDMSVFYKWVSRKMKLIGLVILLALFSLGGLARAEDISDPPLSQKAAGYTVEFLEPAAGNFLAENDSLFRFRVTDAQGQPVNGLKLNVTAIRDYSGQVKKEHNGPRTPNIGPLALTQPAGGGAGEYQSPVRFSYNGHWYVQVDGPSLSGAQVKYRTPVGTAPNQGAGFNLDWLVWAGVLLTVVTIVAVIGRKGEVFPTPHAELEPGISAPPVVIEQSERQEAAPVAASSVQK